MSTRHLLLAFFILTTTLNAVADTSSREEAETLYSQAVELLEQAEPIMHQIEASIGSDDQANLPLMSDRYGRAILPAIQKLEEASRLGSATAQYRLALIYEALPEREGAACELYNRSAEQAFAPAAVRLAASCVGYGPNPEYEALLKNAVSQINHYENTYPQPTVRLACMKVPPEGMQYQWGSMNDFLAEIYILQATRTSKGDSREEKRQLYEKAFALNECSYAKRRLAR
ncbi:MAG: hypothetical protein ACKVLM_00995 [Pseudomonadales bacterium]